MECLFLIRNCWAHKKELWLSHRCNHWWYSCIFESPCLAKNLQAFSNPKQISLKCMLIDIWQKHSLDIRIKLALWTINFALLRTTTIILEKFRNFNNFRLFRTNCNNSLANFTNSFLLVWLKICPNTSLFLS